MVNNFESRFFEICSDKIFIKNDEFINDSSLQKSFVTINAFDAIIPIGYCLLVKCEPTWYLTLPKCLHFDKNKILESEFEVISLKADSLIYSSFGLMFKENRLKNDFWHVARSYNFMSSSNYRVEGNDVIFNDNLVKFKPSKLQHYEFHDSFLMNENIGYKVYYKEA